MYVASFGIGHMIKICIFGYLVFKVTLIWTQDLMPDVKHAQ